jgi:excisionase family DNA binding protein
MKSFARQQHEKRMENDPAYREQYLAEIRHSRKRMRQAAIAARAQKDSYPGGLLTTEQVALRLHVDPRTVHRWVREKRISCVQVSSKQRAFTEEQIQEFVRCRTVQKPNPVVSVDRNRGPVLPSASKRGGQGRKSQDASLRAELRREIRSWA